MTDDDRRMAERLRAYESRVPDPPAPTTSFGGRSARAMFAALGAVALLVGIVIFNNVLSDNIGQIDSTPTPNPTASASPDPSTAATETPTPETESPAPTAEAVGEPQVVMREGTDDTIQYVVGFGHGTAGRVAVLNVSNYASVPASAPSDASGAIYLEADDGTWQLVDTGTTFEGVRPTSLMSPPGQPMVLYGFLTDAHRDREITGAWTSSDGLTWTEADVDPYDGVMAAGPLGYVQARAVGSEPNAPSIEVYWSDDATSWELVHTTPAGVSALPTAAGAGPEGFVVTARTAPDEAPLILASGDGRTWFQAPDQPAFTGDDIVMRAAPIGPDWIAAGWRSVSGQARGIDLWSSADGLTWQMAGSIEPDEDLEGMGDRVMYASHLLSVGGTLIMSGAFAAEGSETRPLGVWTSTDGRLWEELALGGHAEVRDGDGNECCFWLGGRLGSDDGEAVIWRWDPAD